MLASSVSKPLIAPSNLPIAACTVSLAAIAE